MFKLSSTVFSKKCFYNCTGKIRISSDFETAEDHMHTSAKGKKREGSAIKEPQTKDLSRTEKHLEIFRLKENTLQLLQEISSGYPELQSSAPLRASFLDSGGADAFDGSKQWHIKYAFEKVEGSGFKCKICGQIKKHVRNHYLKHFPEHHECHLCRRTYTRKDNLNSHLKRDHFQRVKTPPDSYHRFRRLTKRVHECPRFKCFTPDLYSQINFSSSIPTPAHPVLSHSSPPSGPMDLSIRSSSVPLQPQYTPIYGILPSLYSYFRN